MAILIKGMNMPKSCSDCEWSRLTNLANCYCKIAHKAGDLDTARKERLDICPLIEAPECHGDLIDRDVVLSKAWDSETFVAAGILPKKEAGEMDEWRAE